MSATPDGTRPDGVPIRFPGFDVLSQAGHWDDTTARLVLSRLDPHGPIRFFTEEEFRTASALLGQLIDADTELADHLCGTIDTRLADTQTDGWHYDNLPTDAETWQRCLAGLNDDAQTRFGASFAEVQGDERHELVAAIHDISDGDWHGLPAHRLWDLLMRYACTALYAQPSAWNEIGFPGPAYPRGYKNIGVNALEPFEVPDARPHYDPAAGDSA